MNRKFLLFLPGPQGPRDEYRERLAPRLPGADLHVVATIEDARREIRDAEIFVGYGAFMAGDIFADAPNVVTSGAAIIRQVPACIETQCSHWPPDRHEFRGRRSKKRHNTADCRNREALGRKRRGSLL